MAVSQVLSYSEDVLKMQSSETGRKMRTFSVGCVRKRKMIPGLMGHWKMSISCFGSFMNLVVAKIGVLACLEG